MSTSPSGATFVARKRLGELLVELGYITVDQVQGALRAQRESGPPLPKLGAVLVQSGLLSETHLVHALSTQLGVDVCDPVTTPVHPRVRSLIPRELADRLRIVPISLRKSPQGDALLVATSDPLDATAHKLLERQLGVPITWLLAGETEIDLALAKHYGAQPPAFVVDGTDPWGEEEEEEEDQFTDDYPDLSAAMVSVPPPANTGSDWSPQAMRQSAPQPATKPPEAISPPPPELSMRRLIPAQDTPSRLKPPVTHGPRASTKAAGPARSAADPDALPTSAEGGQEVFTAPEAMTAPSGGSWADLLEASYEFPSLQSSNTPPPHDPPPHDPPPRELPPREPPPREPPPREPPDRAETPRQETSMSALSRARSRASSVTKTQDASSAPRPSTPPLSKPAHAANSSYDDSATPVPGQTSTLASQPGVAEALPFRGTPEASPARGASDSLPKKAPATVRQSAPPPESTHVTSPVAINIPPASSVRMTVPRSNHDVLPIETSEPSLDIPIDPVGDGEADPSPTLVSRARFEKAAPLPALPQIDFGPVPPEELTPPPQEVVSEPTDPGQSELTEVDSVPPKDVDPSGAHDLGHPDPAQLGHASERLRSALLKFSEGHSISEPMHWWLLRVVAALITDPERFDEEQIQRALDRVGDPPAR